MRLLQSLETKDMKAFATVWADNAVQHMPYAPESFPSRVTGKENLLNHYAQWPQNSGKADFTSNLALILLEDDIVNRPQGSTTVPYQFTYSTEGLAPTHVVWISYAAVDLSGQTIKKVYPLRHIFQSDSVEVEDLLDSAPYPVIEHRMPGEPPEGGGGTTGLRRCTRVASCST